MEVKAPTFPESISEGELTKWYKQEGDYVEFTDFDEPYTREKIVMCEAFLKTMRPLFSSLPPDDEEESLDGEHLGH